MSAALRILLILSLTLTATAAWAQESTTTTDATETTATATTATTTSAAEPAATTEEGASGTSNRYEIRSQLTALVHRYSDGLAPVLSLEPSLLSNEQFLKSHPELHEFVTKHPEVAQRPNFYLAEVNPYRRRESVMEEIIEALAIFAVFASIALALAWLVRTIIEQKRWNRLTRTQTEVHTKILDRFGNTEELLQYIKTPAGAKFLESAPIPLHAEQRIQHPPQSRVLWSIQAGVVIAAGALGMLLVSLRFDKETGGDLFALGVIGFFLGAGFIISALVSLGLSRRLGMGQPPTEDADVVR
ncbi:MAG TPA: hypothetical protein VNI54_03530 [Thermoanaerobaculia bacterium]|nr:hypothetical protein [Thermoanaerobaculia bacterium]